MKVSELIKILQDMPQDLPVEINNNLGGEITYVDQVDLFTVDDGLDYPVVMIQTNCEDSE